MAYGKALSTYKKINKIKQSSQKIAEAQVMIGEQRAKSIQEARQLSRRKEMVGAVSNAVISAGAYGMSQSDSINPELASKITATAGGVAELGTSLAVRANPNDMLGLRSHEYGSFAQSNQPDIAGEAIKGYSLQESLNSIRKNREMDRAIDSFSEDEMQGFTKDELIQYRDEVDFNKGYDFGRLPDIAKRIHENRLRNQGLLAPKPNQNPYDRSTFQRPNVETESAFN